MRVAAVGLRVRQPQRDLLGAVVHRLAGVVGEVQVQAQLQHVGHFARGQIAAEAELFHEDLQLVFRGEAQKVLYSHFTQSPLGKFVKR